MLKAAIVGVGFMGWIHYLAYQRSRAATLAAFCSRDDKKRRGDWTGIQGNFGPPGEQISLDGLNAYESLDGILADDSIDLVDICLPPHLHVDAACRSLAAGKHVLCEKPLGLTTADCDQILEAAEKADRRVFVAQVLPYMGEFEYVYRAAESGQFGAVQRAYFKRVISPPDWIPDFYDPTTVGGPLIDLHIHDMHFMRLLFGMPRRVMCSAELNGEVVKFCHNLFEFESPGIIVASSSGVSEQTGRPFCHGFEIQFEKAVMQFELSALTDGVDRLPLRVLKQDGTSELPELPEGDEISGFVAEIDEAATAIATNVAAPRLEAAVARDAIHVCQCLQTSATQQSWVDC